MKSVSHQLAGRRQVTVTLLQGGRTIAVKHRIKSTRSNLTGPAPEIFPAFIDHMVSPVIKGCINFMCRANDACHSAVCDFAQLQQSAANPAGRRMNQNRHPGTQHKTLEQTEICRQKYGRKARPLVGSKF